MFAEQSTINNGTAVS